MNLVAAPPHVTLSGDRAGEYIVTDERPDGELRSFQIPASRLSVSGWAPNR